MTFGSLWRKRPMPKQNAELGYLIEVAISSDIASRVNLAFELGCFVSERDNARVEKESLLPVFEIMTSDPEPEVQVTLAKAMCQSKSVLPRSIIFKLAAEGCEEAASILLKQSPLMSEKLMKHLIHNGTAFHQTCIAGRAGLSPAITSMLMTHCEEEVVVHLLHNEAAVIEESGYRRLLMRFPESVLIGELVGERKGLPAVVSEMLVSKATDRMREAAINKGWLGEAAADDMAVDLREKFTLEIAGRHNSEDAMKLVLALKNSDRLTTSLILRAACTDNMRFVEDAMTQVSRLPIDRVIELLYSGPMGVGAVAARAGFDSISTLALVYAFNVHHELHVTQGKDSDAGFLTRMIERVLSQSDDIDAADQTALLSLLENFSEGADKILATEVIEAIEKAA